jgi:hypothetical protein
MGHAEILRRETRALRQFAQERRGAVEDRVVKAAIFQNENKDVIEPTRRRLCGLADQDADQRDRQGNGRILTHANSPDDSREG